MDITGTARIGPIGVSTRIGIILTGALAMVGDILTGMDIMGMAIFTDPIHIIMEVDIMPAVTMEVITMDTHRTIGEEETQITILAAHRQIHVEVPILEVS